MGNAYNILVAKPEGKNHSEDLSVDGRKIIKSILRKMGRGCELDSTGSGWGLVAGCCEKSNEPSGFINVGGFLD
jgi:hypothetical protein